MQRKDGRVLISFYKGVHANPSALNVPEEPSPEQFAKVGKEVSTVTLPKMCAEPSAGSESAWSLP